MGTGDRQNGKHDAPSPRAPEDFLFHVFRGAELLRDQRTAEAKDELERAIALEPRDTKARDLLAATYARLGDLVRALPLYESLRDEHPRDPQLKTNLALCYLNAGNAEAARNELEDVVRADPNHARAWGYLGIAYQRLGDGTKAANALANAGERQLATRARGDANEAPTSMADPPEAPPGFEPLDGAELAFVRGELPVSRRSAPAIASSLFTARDFAKDARVAFEPGITRHPNGNIVASTRDGAIAIRLDAVRAMRGPFATSPLERQQRGRAIGESFGGAASPIFRATGTCDVVLGARSRHTLTAFRLDGETVYLREDAIVAFDLAIAFESGKLTVGDNEVVPIVQLRGSGGVALELKGALATIDIAAPRNVTARREHILGWSGRIVPHAIPIADAPGGQHGLVGFSGEGTLWLDTE